MSISFFCNIDIIDIAILPPKSALLPNCQRKNKKSLKAVGLQILREKNEYKTKNRKKSLNAVGLQCLRKKFLKSCRSAAFKEKKQIQNEKKKILKSCRPAAFKEKKTNTKRKTKNP